MSAVETPRTLDDVNSDVKAVVAAENDLKGEGDLHPDVQDKMDADYKKLADEAAAIAEERQAAQRVLGQIAQDNVTVPSAAPEAPITEAPRYDSHGVALTPSEVAAVQNGGTDAKK